MGIGLWLSAGVVIAFLVFVFFLLKNSQNMELASFRQFQYSFFPRVIVYAFSVTAFWADNVAKVYGTVIPVVALIASAWVCKPVILYERPIVQGAGLAAFGALDRFLADNFQLLFPELFQFFVQSSCFGINFRYRHFFFSYEVTGLKLSLNADLINRNMVNQSVLVLFEKKLILRHNLN